MFFRRFVAHPLQVGSVIPSSPALCRRLVAQVRRAPDEAPRWVQSLALRPEPRRWAPSVSRPAAPSGPRSG